MALALVLALSACPKSKPIEPPAPPPATEDATESARIPITGPRYWSEPGGLCLEVPPGWSGSSGAPPLLLRLTQADTGFGLEIRAYPLGDPLPDRDGFDLLFEDPGSYRTVELLSPGAGTRSWVSSTPGGPMAQSWHGPIGDRTVEVVAVYPANRATEGEQLMAPIFDAICTTWR